MACFYKFHLDWVFVLIWLDLIWVFLFVSLFAKIWKKIHRSSVFSNRLIGSVGSPHADHWKCTADRHPEWLNQTTKEPFTSSSAHWYDCEEEISLVHLTVIHYTGPQQQEAQSKKALKNNLYFYWHLSERMPDGESQCIAQNKVL